MLASLLLCMTAQGGTPVLIQVDIAKPIGAISPFIYGSNEDDWANPVRHLTIGRQGGNRMTAYNWENNASNAGSDYQNQSDDYLIKSNVPGEYPRRAVATAQAAKASFLVTIPMAGYVAADKNGDGDVNKTPNYLTVRFRQSVPAKRAPFTYPPNLKDKRVYQDEFVWWLEKQFPRRKPGSNIWYSLDNEPDLWSSTHSRIHPNKLTYSEIIEKSVAMGKAIRAVAPETLIFGPASYGWGGYVNLQGAPDAGGRDFLESYLAGVKTAEQKSGKRIVDVLDLHWYPEVYGDGKRIVEQLASPGIAKARMQATRSLWDATFVEDSWITKSLGNKPINLIPRIKAKISKSKPGTKLAFTEYQYGGGNDISGAIAEADALGIFGREGVFAAALWPLNGDSAFVHAAFDAFRNYDGRRSTFGDIALPVKNPDQANLGFYASKFSGVPNKLVFVITNQLGKTRSCALKLNGQVPPFLRQFSLTSSKPKLDPSSFAVRTGHGYQLTLPPLSVNVLELK